MLADDGSSAGWWIFKDAHKEQAADCGGVGCSLVWGWHKEWTYVTKRSNLVALSTELAASPICRTAATNLILAGG
jgi:hypothetical protein